MQRAITWTILVLLCLTAVARVAIACTADSEGLELINGELPGGG
jgi:hypothetical protein